jgi:PAS domain S-box-containing protein
MTREVAIQPDGDEVRRLEGCINDLISILALPATWTGREPSHVLSTLLEALFDMLRLDFAYARLSDAAGGSPIEVVRSAPRPDGRDRPAEVGAALARMSTGVAPPAARVPNPVGDGEVSIASFRLGIGGDAGVLVAGSRRSDFPKKTETLLLRVAANQAGIGVREVRLLGEYRRERTRVEGERRALASLVEHSTDFIAMATPEGQMLFVNPAGRQVVGLEGDAQARATRVLDYVAEEERERFQAYILPAVLREGRWEGQTRFRHFRTGAAIPMLQNIFVIKDPRSDRLLALGTISRDVTERLRTEDNLRDSERRFRLLAEAIPHQVWSRLPDGSLDYGNRRWMDYTGLTPEDIRRDGWTTHVHPDDVGAIVEAWQEASAHGHPYEAEQRLRGVDGRYRRFLSRAVPVQDEQGHLVQWFGTDTDIEARKQAEEALRDVRADLAHISRLTTMGELAASLAHELNQPLAAVVTNGTACLRWLGRAEPNLAEATDAVQRIIRDANRAAAVIVHTRALLRKSGGDKASLDITEVISEVLVLVQPEVLRHRIVVIRESLAEDLPTIMGDRIQLQQVLLNLIMNGIEAMTAVEDGHRELAIRVQRHDVQEVPGILVAVRDAGVGIAPDSLDRLFDAFYTTKVQGLGMGLSISRSIIQGHGGRLWATANAGPGATLQFAIPAGNKRGS